MKAKSETKDNMELLIDYDDRFHPVIGMDLSARFLTDLCPTPSTQYP
ncbi:MAG: hypothetical protein LBO09_06720 [Candidatus Peribacteria bacterium]|nr:hypothetical protein [Candidatus Peribacteria bacterium]